MADFWHADFSPADFPADTPSVAARAYLYGDIPVLGPIGVAVTGITNEPVLAIGTDPVRHGILFHNPNSATVLRIFPAGIMPSSGSGGIVIEPFAFFELYASTGGNLRNDDGRVRVNTAWAVVADSIGSAGLTIWNFTDNNPAVAAPERVASINVNIDIPSPVTWQTSSLTTGSSSFIGFNQNRRGIQFVNPGTQNKAISPANLAATIGAGSIVLLPQTSKMIAARGKVRVNCGFNAATADGSDGALTALEFT